MGRNQIRHLQYALPVLIVAVAAALGMLFLLDGDQRLIGLGVIVASSLFALIFQNVLIRKSEAEHARNDADIQRFKSEAEDARQVRMAFAKAASHDMLEPLRKVEAFGERLEEKYADRLEDSGRLYVNRMRDAAERMRGLIEQLLSFARLDDHAPLIKRHGLSNLVETAKGALKAQIKSADAKITVESGPELITDERLVSLILVQLMANALKFRSPERLLHIEIHHERVECEGGIREKIMVSDNGIGFDPRYNERIFGVLDRLHSRSEFEGTGMGLAVARKAAERLGGTLTAEGESGKGARFTLILPVQQ